MRVPPSTELVVLSVVLLAVPSTLLALLHMANLGSIYRTSPLHPHTLQMVQSCPLFHPCKRLSSRLPQPCTVRIVL